MAIAHEEYLNRDDFDAVLDIIESDFLEYGDEFQQDMNVAVEKTPKINNSPSYPCSFCAKFCLSKGGLTRHISSKHYLETVETNAKVRKMLLPDIFYDIIQKSFKKLAQDECYPEEICSQFSNFRMSGSVADLPAYNLVTPVISSFNGDVEKFYPRFYKFFVDAEDPFRGLDVNCTRLLGFKIANHILAYITRATNSDDVVHFDCDTKFSAKEKSLIVCLSGYVFGAFYRQIGFSKTAHQDQTYHQQCLSFLVAGKSVGETVSLPEHRHVDVLNRGGLWKVNEDVIAIFSVAETYFLSSTRKLQNKIVSKDIVNALMENCMLLENFAKVRRSSLDNIKEEIAFNLLEDLLTLYIRVRTFSYVKDKVQAFKIRNSKTKSRSLRTGMKQPTSFTL